jgi:hypothetical protein
MHKFLSRAALILALPALAALTFPGAAAADPGSKLSFAASSDGASAGWSAGPGSPIDLTLGSSPGTYALVSWHNPTEVSKLAEPTFTTDNYAAGSPRFFITLNDGDTLWGYPPNSGLNGGTDFAWAINNGNTYLTWSQVQAAEGSAHVTSAEVIADGDQAPGTTDAITCLSFNGVTYNGC